MPAMRPCACWPRLARSPSSKLDVFVGPARISWRGGAGEDRGAGAGRRREAKSDVRAAGPAPFLFTVSIGVATRAPGEHDLEAILRREARSQGKRPPEVSDVSANWRRQRRSRRRRVRTR
jgi:hypothetical protein